jgi:hypothetical protein
MPEPADQPARHTRSLTGFYIMLGVVAALVGAGAWVWKPALVKYHESRVRALLSSEGVSGRKSSEDERVILKLAEIGPASLPAFERMILVERLPGSDELIYLGLDRREQTWAMPLLARLLVEHEVPVLDYHALNAAETLSQRMFFDRDFTPRNSRDFRGDVERARQEFLAWWEREGQAQYGGRGK